MSKKEIINRRSAIKQMGILSIGGLAGLSEMKAAKNIDPSKRGKKMEKNILALASSARKGGNSDLLSEEFIRGGKEAGHLTEKIYLADKNIKGCLGCGVCGKDNNRCIQRDDMDDIYAKILKADILVLASPVYFYTFNAQMKALMDRSYALIRTMKDKTVYLLATGAAPTKDSMSVMIDCFRKYIECFTNIKEGGIVHGVGVSGKGDIKSTPAMQEAYTMGNNI